MRYVLVALALVFATGASAQQKSTPLASVQQRIEAQIGALVLQNASLSMQVELLQRQLAEAQAKIKTSEAPAASPPSPPEKTP